MNRLLRFWRSTIGKKVVMAATGIIGIGFLIAHVAGNLLVFSGPVAMNQYSRFLHGPAAELLWPMRVVLGAAVLLHVLAAIQLARLSRAARPYAYVKRKPQASPLGSSLMRWGGAFLLVFIVVHILHFTTGSLRPTGRFVAGDVYGNLVASFELWWVALFYVVAVALLGLYTAFMLGLKWFAPGYIEAVWNLAALRGGLVYGIPVEELLFGFAFGLHWAGVYEHFSWNQNTLLTDHNGDGRSSDAAKSLAGGSSKDSPKE